MLMILSLFAAIVAVVAGVGVSAQRRQEMNSRIEALEREVDRLKAARDMAPSGGLEAEVERPRAERAARDIPRGDA